MRSKIWRRQVKIIKETFTIGLNVSRFVSAAYDAILKILPNRNKNRVKNNNDLLIEGN